MNIFDIDDEDFLKDEMSREAIATYHDCQDNINDLLGMDGNLALMRLAYERRHLKALAMLIGHLEAYKVVK